MTNEQRIEMQITNSIESALGVKVDSDLKRAGVATMISRVAVASDIDMGFELSETMSGVRKILNEVLMVKETLKNMPVTFAASHLKLSSDAFSDGSKLSMIYTSSKANMISYLKKLKRSVN